MPWYSEASATLRAVQRETLGMVTWADTVADLPDAPLFLLAGKTLADVDASDFAFAPSTGYTGTVLLGRAA